MINTLESCIQSTLVADDRWHENFFTRMTALWLREKKIFRDNANDMSHFNLLLV